MFRSSLIILLILIILFTNGKNLTNPIQNTTSTRKPVSIKICGPALVQMLDMICQRAKQILMKKQKSSHEKRHMIIDDDPFTRTLLIKDFAQFNNTLVGDCCLQACTLKTLLKYC
ncbi:unnamed protein product [Rotaria sordida]|uniref:Insulin-like domain-containing protein n=1 Tax=Rotaria sordida TaxID=392033 RepID=A0A818S7X9_9BILA|nr:unnamed protein product [Rotaria sordida]CAF1056315.1 unnamed protein product [Rotaria sordida]CAF1111741.1 unnamed protein product [Rotaria sordida]CAF1142357.1 unnamed protein product [Rotaria sordida]CAF1264668.1 unnamed protein product [Rotaria sordida]